MNSFIKDAEGFARDKARVDFNMETLKKSGRDRLQIALANPVAPQVGRARCRARRGVECLCAAAGADRRPHFFP